MCLKLPRVSFTSDTQANVPGNWRRISWKRTIWWRFTTQIKKSRGSVDYMPRAGSTVTPWPSSSMSRADRAGASFVTTSNFSARLPPLRMLSLMRELR